MILVDYSQTSISAITATKNLLGSDEAKNKDIIRHVILATLLSYKKKHRAKYGNIVICADGRHYWRRDYFSNYKSKRKAQRESSSLPWKLIFDTMTEVRLELESVFPYPIVWLDHAEADDCIAVLAEWTQTNNLTQVGLFEEPENILIISSDHDFAQLQKYKNVRQWSPKTKKYVDASTKDLKENPIIHIVKGDSGDSIPNIFSDDNVFVDGRKQKSVMQERLDDFIENGYGACRTDEERRNWSRNIQLVSFDYIPEEIKNDIIEVYESQKPKVNRMKIFDYLVKNKCRLLLDSIEDF